MARLNWSEVAPEGAKALYGVHHYVVTRTNLPAELICPSSEVLGQPGCGFSGGLASSGLEI